MRSCRYNNYYYIGSLADRDRALYLPKTTPTIVKPKRSTARQLSGSKYLDNLEKEVAIRLVAKNTKKKKKHSTVDNTVGSDSKLDNPSRSST